MHRSQPYDATNKVSSYTCCLVQKYHNSFNSVRINVVLTVTLCPYVQVADTYMVTNGCEVIFNS